MASRDMQGVQDTGAANYRPAGQGPVQEAQSQYRDGMNLPVHNKDRNSIQVLPRPQPSRRTTPQTLEQEQYITQIASQQEFQTTAKDTMMQKIASQLQNMGLKEIQRFEASLPSTMSNVRYSRRLQGCPPDTVESTGNPLEDSRLLFKGDTVQFRK